MELDRAFVAAMGQHRAGRLAEAEQAYRGILATAPGHAGSLHLLGVLASQRGDHRMAVELIGRAIAQNPGQPVAEFHNNLGLALRALGETSEAIRHYRQAIVLKPDYADAHNNLGAALLDQGEALDAAISIERAITLRPADARARYNLGNIRRAQGRLDDAASCYRQVIALKPGMARAHYNLGIVLATQGKPDEAVAAYRDAIAIQPDLAEAHNNLGLILEGQGKLNDAVVHYEKAVAIQPDYAEAHNNLGNALSKVGKPGSAFASYRQAIALKPGYAEAHYNFGLALQDSSRLDEALAEYREAQSLRSNYAEAHWSEALLHLLRGDFAAAWEKYEWRQRTGTARARVFDPPVWDGGDIAGRTILLHAEEGFGDTLQFIRYTRLVKQRGATVIVECQPELVDLLREAPGIDRLVAAGDPLPPFDCHAPLLSLPRLMGTLLDTVPGETPYLRVPSGAHKAWRGAISGKGPHVGLIWRGNPRHANDRRRSIQAEIIAGLCAVPGIDWIGLQKDATADEIAALSAQAEIRNLGLSLNGWADTAAIIASLDLVVTVDTAIAHLAGALGKPAWVLIPFAPDWRWLLGRTDSPWYPTLRLFRQAAPEDWSQPLAEIRTELMRLAA